MCFLNILVIKQINIWIPQKKSTGIEMLINFLCYFLRYYLMMQHQPTVKRVNGTHEWAHRPYQLLITAACTNTGGKMKDSRHRAADRCPFVLRHSLSQVTSFMQLGMLWYDSKCEYIFCNLENNSACEKLISLGSLTSFITQLINNKQDLYGIQNIVALFSYINTFVKLVFNEQ